MNVLKIPLIVAAPSNADKASMPFNLRNAENVRIQVKGVETSTPVGSFKLFGTEDVDGAEADLAAMRGGATTPTIAQWTPLNIPAAAVHGSGFSAVTDGDDHISWDGTNPLNMLIDLDGPPAYMYLLWDRSSGGSASTDKITARAGARGNQG